ncbi:sugar O-acyltransferase, sialic acid O-acetyltransferase NeuD family [Emticicia oligotrophica DSM 17448]|uniref:Sugar O-acyltransferase, sialic acid O-acetyltransferase NeuD family n=1 Tax=Emticicia oligotrophica (strain DSM 17448 / CIP 109782 / MTCC 6937 / GPTSA100-15) TaxID=929562 RepID=A0ABM5N1K7_EMTOG|nr:acetyltransferase [Emticicia oligotrophica]AFK03209.1 sugar O-acyltransferase, sialic acid O-acetyltransferase NeuD family [Emticicia oligotrophica DSM 17448]
MLLYGASGHAKVILEALNATHTKVSGIFDDNISIKKILDFEVIGTYESHLFMNDSIIVAIGDNMIRRAIVKKITHKFGVCFHPSALISKYTEIGEGTVIFQNAILQPSVKIGKHVIINTKSSVDHDCIVGDFVHIAPNATLCGGVKVGDGTLIGAGAVILPNVEIGENCIIGAGSVVVRNISNNLTVKGNPSK